jgi:hypothetical protein
MALPDSQANSTLFVFGERTGSPAAVFWRNRKRQQQWNAKTVRDYVLPSLAESHTAA